jgi:SAM-dependent methyltransferase
MLLDQYSKYLSDRFELKPHLIEGDEIIEGVLFSRFSSDLITIRRGIPRFVDDEGYAKNFGMQWTSFRTTQLDSKTGLPLTFNRFWNNTKWQPKDLYGKTVLECGCGAGRFTEILLSAGAKVVSFDMTSAVDANQINNSKKGELFLFQGDINNIPFPDDYFDFVFCYGVLQHTEFPIKSYKSIFDKLKPGGSISIDYYRKMRYPSVWTTPKYFWRPITTKMRPETLLRIIRGYIPLWLPIDTFFRKIPIISNILSYIPIPCWNYIRMGLNYQQRKEWAVMDTFDALGARYDYPKTIDEVKAMIASDRNAYVELFYGSNGIVANIVKSSLNK